MTKLRDGLELLKSGSAIGKVVVVNYDEEDTGNVFKPIPVQCLTTRPLNKWDNCTVLITGG